MARRVQKPKTEPKQKAIKINRQGLLDALTLVKPGLANSELIEQSTHFIFDNDKIWTYNDQITIMHGFESGITGAVRAEEFYKLLGKIPDDVISVSSEKGKLKFSGKKIKAVIKVDPDIKLQPIKVPGLNSKQWETLPENFSDAIAFSAFSASRNMIRPDLCCLFITGNKCVSCDSFRGTKYKLGSKMKSTFLLPATAAVQLAKYNPYKIIADQGWLHFVNKEHTTFSCRTYPDTDYPERIWDFFKVEGQEIALPEDFLEAIDRAQVMLTADFDLDRFVSLTMADNVLVCKGEGDCGWIEEKADISYTGNPIDIKVHPILLSQILKYLSTVVIGERLLFKGKDFEHAVCLSM